MRRSESGDHQWVKCVCGKKQGGRNAARGKLRLGIVLVKTAPDNGIDDPEKWSPGLDLGSIIEFKTDSFKPSEESDSNVEVTGEAL